VGDLPVARAQADTLEVPGKMKEYNELLTIKNVVMAATGATAIYLVSKSLLAMFQSPPYNPEPFTLARLSVEYYPIPSARVNVPGELRRLLQALTPNLDDDSKRTTLHNITQYIYLKESEEYVPKIAELVTSNWDTNLQVAGLRLLNGLHIPDNTHSLLRKLLPNFFDILLMANTLAKAPPEFLSLFQPSLPGNLLSELLIFVERLSAGRLSPQYQSVQWQYNDNSLHEVIFGDNSRLSDRLLALIIHPEEEVQAQACKVILSLRLNKEESRVISGLPFGANISVHPLESTRASQADTSSLSNHPLFPNTVSADSVGDDNRIRSAHDESNRSFYPLQGADETGHSFYPLERADHSFHPMERVSVHTSGRVLEDDSRGSFHPIGNLDDSGSSCL
ncbi:hypothetical protein JD844_018230, partial [Phrynosoma platyrhinos]